MITETNIKQQIEATSYFQSLSGTNKFKQALILKRSKQIYHDYELAKRQGVDYVKQFVSVGDAELIRELLTIN